VESSDESQVVVIMMLHSEESSIFITSLPLLSMGVVAPKELGSPSCTQPHSFACSAVPKDRGILLSRLRIRNQNRNQKSQKLQTGRVLTRRRKEITRSLSQIIIPS
jgi:hypothetical protein